MVLAIQKLDTGTAVAADGIFLPVASLPGITSAEMVVGISDRKIALALSNAIYSTLNALTAKLGIQVTKGNLQSGSASDKAIQNFSFVTTHWVNFADNTVDVLPLNGDDDGLVFVRQAFANAAPAAAAATPGKGIVIPDTTITGNGGTVPANTTAADARSFFAALYNEITQGLATNENITVKSRGAAQGLSPIAAWTDSTAPTTGLVAADLLVSSFFNLTQSVSYVLTLDQSTQTFDIL